MQREDFCNHPGYGRGGCRGLDDFKKRTEKKHPKLGVGILQLLSQVYKSFLVIQLEMIGVSLKLASALVVISKLRKVHLYRFIVKHQTM